MNNCPRLAKLMISIVLFAQTTPPVSAMIDVPKAIMGKPTESIQNSNKGAQAGDSVKTEVTLEKAINIVRESFSIPKTFTDFSSSFSNENYRQVWFLTWREPSEAGGNFVAHIDAGNGEIISINTWKPSKPGNGPAPEQLTYAQAQEIATDLIKKLLGERIKELESTPDNTQIIPLFDRGTGTHTIKWRRVVNGIPFPANGVSMQVNKQDGSVSSYHLNWYKGDFPSPQQIISADKARTSFEADNLFELQYFTLPFYRTLLKSETNKVKTPFLIYQLNQLSHNGMIDALSGEPFRLAPGEWLNGDDSLDKPIAYGADGKGEASAQPLTPEEQKEVDKAAKLLSQEQAMVEVKKWFELPTDLTLHNASLGQDNGRSARRVWNLSWSKAEPIKGLETTRESTPPGEAQYVSARVDATTGELLGFHASHSYPPSVLQQTIGRQEAFSIACEFLKRVQPSLYDQVKPLDPSATNQKPADHQIIQDFQFQRISQNVPFPGNGFQINVDTVSRKVTGYDFKEWALILPPVSEAMNSARAHELFLSARPLALKYIQIYQNGQPGEIRLVYQPKLENPLTVSNRIDAIHGKFLDWQGNPLIEQPHPYAFRDITGNYAEKEIFQLGQAGIFGEYNDLFKPEEEIKLVSQLRAMLKAKNSVWAVRNSSDEEILKQAKEAGWLKENLGAESPVSRDLQAKLMIRMLKLDKIAKIEGIFQTSFADSSSIDTDSLGYIALYQGLKLIPADNTNFEPLHNITRADAAYSLFHAIRVDSEK